MSVALYDYLYFDLLTVVVRVLTGQTAGLEGQRCATGLVRVFPHTTDCPQPPARPGIQIGPKIVRLNAVVSLSGESGYRGPAVR